MKTKAISLLLLCTLCLTNTLKADVVYATVEGQEVPPHAMKKILKDEQLEAFNDKDSSFFSWEAALYDGELEFYWVRSTWGAHYARISKGQKLAMVATVAFTVLSIVLAIKDQNNHG